MDYKDYIAGQTESNFWFRTKYKLLDYLMGRLKRSNFKILDIGTGVGEYLNILKKYGEVYAVDIDENALSMIPEGICKEKKVCDAQNISYPDNFFDVVVSFDVFEHIEEDITVIQEVKRVLKRGGHLVFSVPAFPALFSAHDRALEHKRRYTKKMMAHRLRNGFERVMLNYWNVFLFIPLLIKNTVIPSKGKKLGNINVPKPLSEFIFLINRIELFLLKKKAIFPFGTSLFGVYKKIF